MEQLREALDDSPITGANIEEAIQKIKVDTYEYVDKVDIVLKTRNVLLAEAESASIADTSAPAQRNVSTLYTYNSTNTTRRCIQRCNSSKAQFSGKGLQPSGRVVLGKVSQELYRSRIQRCPAEGRHLQVPHPIYT